MIRELVLHLGDCKTGTTSVQHALANEQWQAAGRSIIYPARVNHIPLAKTLTTREDKPFYDKRFGRMHRSFCNSDADQGVISAEHFEFVKPQDLHAALVQHLPEFTDKIRLVAYVRPHPDRLVSTFAERAKKGNFYGQMRGMHEKLKKEGLLLYAPRFRAWKAVFGDRFTVRPMIRSRLFGQDVVQDFFNFVFEGVPFTLRPDGEANSSLTLEDLAMMRAIHQRIRATNPDINRAQQALGWNIAPMLAAHRPASQTKPQLHRKLAEAIRDTYREDAAAMDAEFFDGSPMTEALETAAEKALAKAQSVAPRDHFGAAELARLHAVADMFARLMATDPKFFARAARPLEQRAEVIRPGQEAQTP